MWINIVSEFVDVLVRIGGIILWSKTLLMAHLHLDQMKVLKGGDAIILIIKWLLAI